MRVLYPKLVEEAYNYIAKAEPAVKNAPNAVKSEIYSKMVYYNATASEIANRLD